MIKQATDLQDDQDLTLGRPSPAGMLTDEGL
jgi:hypothetical protein